LTVSGKVFGPELESDKAVEAGVLGFVDHSHAATAQPSNNAGVRNGPTGECIGVQHSVDILGCVLEASQGSDTAIAKA
jgi:hypothetical protein